MPADVQQLLQTLIPVTAVGFGVLCALLAGNW